MCIRDRTEKHSLNQPVLLHRRRDERRKQRMGVEGARFQFGMKLHADEPGVIGYFHDLRQAVIGRPAGDFEALIFELLCVAGVHFIAVAMAFADFGRAIDFRHAAARCEHSRVSAQPHRTAHVAISVPRSPKPPGTRMPSTFSRNAAASSRSNTSLSIQSIWTFTLLARPPCTKASLSDL